MKKFSDLIKKSKQSTQSSNDILKGKVAITKANDDQMLAFGWADWYTGTTQALSIYGSANNSHSGIIEGKISSRALLIKNKYLIQINANDGSSNLDVFCQSCNIFGANSTKYSQITASNFNKGSSKFIKENIQSLTEEEANKILDVNIVSFDYKKEYGGTKNCRGVIAEQVYDIIPSAVTVPDKKAITAYKNDKEFEFDKISDAPSVDYSQFVPYLIKKVQMQEKEIQKLKERLGL